MALTARQYNVNTNPNLLPDIVATEWDTEIVGAPLKKERANVVEQVAPETKRARKTAVLAVSLIAVVFAIFAGILWRYAIISEVGKENVRLETQIADQYSRNDNLNMDILEKSDLRGVQEKAALLNMGFAENSQIRYIQLSAENTHNSEAATEEDMNFLEKLLKWEF